MPKEDGITFRVIRLHTKIMMGALGSYSYSSDFFGGLSLEFLNKSGCFEVL